MEHGSMTLKSSSSHPCSIRVLSVAYFLSGRSILPPRDVLCRWNRPQIRLHFLQRFRTDPAHSAKLRMVDKPSALLARNDDALCQRLADAGQLGQFRPVGLIDVDQELGLQLR